MGMENELQIVYLSPEELTPYEGNTRKHGPEDIEQIKASIQADGFNDPLGVWGEKNLIVEGHGRQIAVLARAGVRYSDCKTGGQRCAKARHLIIASTQIGLTRQM